MLQFATIEIKNSKARKIIADLEKQKLLQIVSESKLEISAKKKKRAQAFLKSYRDAQLGVMGKKKLLSAKELLDEL